MNPETGEIRTGEQLEELLTNGKAPKPWVMWQVDEVVEIKECFFQVAYIDTSLKLLTLRFISKERALEIRQKKEEKGLPNA